MQTQGTAPWTGNLKFDALLAGLVTFPVAWWAKEVTLSNRKPQEMRPVRNAHTGTPTVSTNIVKMGAPAVGPLSVIEALSALPISVKHGICPVLFFPKKTMDKVPLLGLLINYVIFQGGLG